MNVQSGYQYIVCVYNGIGNIRDVETYDDYRAACFRGYERAAELGLKLMGPYTCRYEADPVPCVLIELWRYY